MQKRSKGDNNRKLAVLHVPLALPSLTYFDRGYSSHQHQEFDAHNFIDLRDILCCIADKNLVNVRPLYEFRARVWYNNTVIRHLLTR